MRKNNIQIKLQDMKKYSYVRKVRWNKTNVECYRRLQSGQGCNGCYYQELFSSSDKIRTTDFQKERRQECHMKATILELIRLGGLPEEEELQTIEGENYECF